MVSKVDICNYALQNIGANSITTLTEDTPEAIECNLRYDTARKSLLELHPWNFALKRASLNKEVETPAFGYDNQFALPTDFVRMIATEEQIGFINHGSSFNGYVTISNRNDFAEADNYKIEMNSSGGKILLSNDDTKKILYVFNQTSEATFAPMFIELLAKGLSAAMAYRITNNRTLAQTERQEFEEMLRQTKLTDAQQGTYERTEQSAFLGARN